ncbi:MAG: dTMP kinase [Anaerolineae bacterium]|nr:dTMP kinase [Anaerolineae bacterium]
MREGLFITFEGPDGSGKTTQIRLLYQYLQGLGYPVYLTREPGGTSIGDQIRAVLHDVHNTEMYPEAEILLYSASRAQLVRQVIRPRLAAGEIVLCDRYAESTLAYQGYGRQLDLLTLRAITAFATDGLRPDLIVYLDLPVEEGLRRRLAAYQTSGEEWNRLDQEEVAFHRRVRAGYLEMAAAEPARWLVLDAAQAVDVIQKDIRKAVMARLEKAHGDSE